MAEPAIVVHGGAAPATTQSVQQFLRDLGMEVFTLPPGPREGKSAIAALERHPGAAFAVLLLGPEDYRALWLALRSGFGWSSREALCACSGSGVRTTAASP